MYGAGYYGALVFGAGLVVTSLTPVPPAGASNGYGPAVYGAHVYGAGAVVTSQTPVPPAPTTTQGNGYGTSYYGAHVYGAGVVVTSQVPVPPVVAAPSATLSPGTVLAVGLRHQARLALRQAPARVAGRGRVVPREQTEEGALELLLLLDDD